MCPPEVTASWSLEPMRQKLHQSLCPQPQRLRVSLEHTFGNLPGSHGVPLSTCLDLRVRQRKSQCGLGPGLAEQTRYKPQQTFRPSNFYFHKSSSSPSPWTAGSGCVPCIQQASDLQKILAWLGWWHCASLRGGYFFFY